MIFSKAEAGELARLESILSNMEGRVRRAFAQFVTSMKSEEVVREVADLLAAGDFDAALGIANSHVASMATVIPEIFSDAAVAEAAAFAEQLRALRPTVAVSFDPTDPLAAMLMRENSLSFIREFTDEQRMTTREALSTALDTGEGRQATARVFRDSIGLTRFQLRAVDSYRRQLEAGSRQALDRALRDRRFDPSVTRAADGGEPLSPEKIDRMVERYRVRALASRAETIARTESVRTISEAREAAFRQTLTDAGLGEDSARQVWHAVGDHRTRWTHRAMNGQERSVNEPFASPSGAFLRYPGDPRAPAGEVINCRCHRTFKFQISALLRAA